MGGGGASRTCGALGGLEGLRGDEVGGGAVRLEAREGGGLERGGGADAGEIRAAARGGAGCECVRQAAEDGGRTS